MPLLNTLVSTADAMRAFDRALNVTQNNVANVNTPGYVKQRLTLSARPMDPDVGSVGGVAAGGLNSARDLYAEQAVRRQTVLLGRDQQRVNSLTALQSVFDVTGNSGVPAALNNLFGSFSAWAQSASDPIAQRNVLERAADMVQAFQHTAASLAGVAVDTERQIQHTVDSINRIVGTLNGYNLLALRGNSDPALDANIHTALEELSQYAEITALHQSDGSVTVLLNGQTPLVMADRQFPIRYSTAKPTEPPPVYDGARPDARILASDGVDITAATTGGKLGALMDFRNRVLGSYIGDSYQQGDLSRMAGELATRINGLLAQGGGQPLFTFDASDPTSIARTIAVNPALGPNDLAASLPGPPVVSNGVPLALSKLSHPEAAADKIDGISYTEFFGGMAARAGRMLNDAKEQAEVQQATVAQARQLREQSSGVSLDEEALILIQFQRAYEANSRLITVLDRLTKTVIDMLQ